jgi:phosphoglycerol transferase MdoB-like AlkP superfamily enzyme
MSRKVLNIITLVLFIISIAVGIFTFANISAIEGGNEGRVNPLFYWTAILFFVALILLIVLPIPAMIKNPQSLKKVLLTIAAVVVVVFIVYLVSQGNPEGDAIMSTLATQEAKDVYIADSLVANMNLYGCYIVIFLTFLAIIWSVVKDTVKK